MLLRYLSQSPGAFALRPQAKTPSFERTATDEPSDAKTPLNEYCRTSGNFGPAPSPTERPLTCSADYSRTIHPTSGACQVRNPKMLGLRLSPCRLRGSFPLVGVVNTEKQSNIILTSRPFLVKRSISWASSPACAQFVARLLIPVGKRPLASSSATPPAHRVGPAPQAFARPGLCDAGQRGLSRGDARTTRQDRRTGTALADLIAKGEPCAVEGPGETPRWTLGQPSARASRASRRPDDRQRLDSDRHNR